MDICVSTMQLITGSVSVRLHMGLHHVHDDGRADSNEGTSIVPVEGMVVQVSLHSAGCIVCWPAEQSACNLGFFDIYVQ